jgi:hypothetical protein
LKSRQEFLTFASLEMPPQQMPTDVCLRMWSEYRKRGKQKIRRPQANGGATPPFFVPGTVLPDYQNP